MSLHRDKFNHDFSWWTIEILGQVKWKNVYKSLKAQISDK